MVSEKNRNDLDERLYKMQGSKFQLESFFVHICECYTTFSANILETLPVLRMRQTSKKNI